MCVALGGGGFTVHFVADLVGVEAVAHGEPGWDGLLDRVVEAPFALVEVEAVNVFGALWKLLERLEPVGPRRQAARLVVPRICECLVQRDRLVGVVDVAVLRRAPDSDVRVCACERPEILEHLDRVLVWVAGHCQLRRFVFKLVAYELFPA